MLPNSFPERLKHGFHATRGVLDFLARYEGWKQAGHSDACDLALGNPQHLAMEGFVAALEQAVRPKDPEWYAYKMSEPDARSVVSDALQKRDGRSWIPEDVFLTNGATGALLVVMNVLIGSGDEVVYPSPHWFFYEGMIRNQGGIPRSVSVSQNHDLDIDAIEAALSPATSCVIINSPNNPTGRLYSESKLHALARILREASLRYGRPIYLISDEAYRTILFDGKKYRSPTEFYEQAFMVYTYGKTLLTPGQRLGYVALSPAMQNRRAMREAIRCAQILNGWAMSSALMQHAIAKLETLRPDIETLQLHRDTLVAGLNKSGFETVLPDGAFYVCPKTPIADDLAYADRLAEKGVYCLPGSVVGMPGHLRLSITANMDMISRALKVFESDAAERRRL
jgi:aspartate aminotransferase